MPRHRLTPLTVLLVLLVTAIAGCGEGDRSATPGQPREIELALDFQPNAVHAGVFAASEGIDSDNNLELVVRAPSASTDSLKLLAAGRSDFSIVDIHDLGLARQQGADVVGIGAIVKRPLAAVIAKPGIGRPRDLEGRRVGVTGLPSDDAVLDAVLRSDGSGIDRVRKTTIGFSAVPSLVAGKVDAVVTFWNAEGVALRRRGVRTREFRVDHFGAPAYPELVIATKRSTLRHDPDLVRRLLRTIDRGTKAALADRGAAVADIARRSGSDEALVRAQLDAVAPALEPPLTLERGPLEAWARFDARSGILRSAPNVDQAFGLGSG